MCKLLELDNSLKPKVESLKNNLLRMVGVGAFAPKAEYSAISNSKVIIDITCEFCSSTTDIDICNDLNLLDDLERKTLPVFVCGTCEEPLTNARTSIELSLLDEVKNLASNYYNQDIKCEKCRDVSGNFLRRICKKDARNLRNSRGCAELKGQLRSLKTIAGCYNFKILSENIQFQIESLP